MKKTCLIVDDSRTTRWFARQILEGLSFATAEAADGAQALAACAKSMPDVILLDWNMPVMNGVEFLAKLRVSDGGDKPIVLFCTTENAMPYIEKAMELGANEYIMKPFDGDILASKLALQGLI